MKSIQIQLGIALAVFIAALDTSITNTLLPVISDAFGIANNLSIYSVFIYQLIMVAFTIPLLNYGRIKGLNQIFTVGILVFIIGALIAGFSTNFSLFIIGRVTQAFGATAILGCYNAILKQTVPQDKLGKWIGVTALTIALGLSLGPSLASFLLKFISWNSIFLFNVPIGIVAFLIVKNKLPQPKPTNTAFDWQLNIIIVFALALILFGLNYFKQPNEFILGLIFLVFATVFLRIIYKRSINTNQHVFPFQLLSQSRIVFPLLATIFVFIIQSIAYIGLPIILYKNFAISTIKIGYLISPWPLMGAFFAPIAGYLSDRIDSIKLSIMGLIILGIGMIGITLSFPQNENSYLVYAMMICGIGFGFFQAPNIKSIMNGVKEKESGNASGLLAVFRVLGQALGSIIVACFMLNFKIDSWKILFYFASGIAFLGTLSLLISYKKNKI